jgi:N,N'-diacetyllegionaminate synthase
MNNKVIIIAEAGVNHNGSLSLAKELVTTAAAAGADYVKFQTFKAENLVSKVAKKAEYQTRNMPAEADVTQFSMLKQLELSYEDHLELIHHCKDNNIKFLSTAFDLESVDSLRQLGIKLWKIPSGEITNLPYLRAIGALNQDVILSTGMSTLDEVASAVDVLVEEGTERKRISLLHCTTEYPTPFAEVNLRAINKMAAHFELPIGYSDHTMGIEVAIAAVAMGSVIIEKHFTLDRTMEGPDHKASLEPAELVKMIASIRNLEMAFGDGNKKPSPSESHNIVIVRKSVHLKYDVKKGHILQEEDMVMMRPGDGISPMQLDNIVGREVLADLIEGHKLTWENLVSEK